MKQKFEIDNIGNLKDSERKIQMIKLQNEIDNCIRLIRQHSGFGQIIISIYENKVSNIKTSSSKDLK